MHSGPAKETLLNPNLKYSKSLHSEYGAMQWVFHQARELIDVPDLCNLAQQLLLCQILNRGTKKKLTIILKREDYNLIVIFLIIILKFIDSEN